jgi:long-chain fatty acid adenylyltransferase FadD28
MRRLGRGAGGELDGEPLTTASAGASFVCDQRQGSLPVTDTSLPALLRERASLQPDDIAFTFIDYEQDWDGVTKSLTWAQLYRRARNLVPELRRYGSTGDRAVILAPQGLDYIVAFLGAMEAGLIAVPLSVPMVGIHDERVTEVLRDSSPSIILTTSSAIESVVPYAEPSGGTPAPAVIAIDSLDLDTRKRAAARRDSRPSIAYLQYTSGSTRAPTGVMVSNRNLSVNFEQIMAGLFPDYGKVAPPTTCVSWLPFYHDMGLMCLCAGVLGGWRTVVMSPMAFLQRPARWMQLIASYPRTFSAAPNFAFELAAGRTTDDDMGDLDLGDVLYILSGAERVNPATLRRFNQRFARCNLPEAVIRPGYGLAEATLYVATRGPERPQEVVHFEPEKLSAGHAKRCAAGTPLVSYGAPQSPVVRVVDPETATETPAEEVGEIWVHGDNVAMGYWRRPSETEDTFGAAIANPSEGTPEKGWLRSGDLGVISEGELFIVGRIKDVLIVRGRNHYPDDIEATIQEISGGRVAAVAVANDHSEKLVAIIEVKKRGQSEEELIDRLRKLKAEVTSAISDSHGLSVADLVLVAPGSIPITTSGKIRRTTCVEFYQDGKFERLDATSNRPPAGVRK